MLIARQHDELPQHVVPRIRTRILVDDSAGAEATTVWEQWIDPQGFIPPHYHEVEETLIVLAGAVEFRQDEETRTLSAPVTIIVPAGRVHALRPVGEAPVRLLAIFPVVQPKIIAPDGALRPLPWDDHQTTTLD